MSLIELHAVAKRFATAAGTVVALESATLSVDTGELVIVLGPSGSGKTTLLNMIGALDTPSEGSIEVAGRRLTGASSAELFEYRRKTVSFVFQAFNLFPELTALENVRFGAEIATHKDAAARAKQTLDDVGLGMRAHHYPHELSGGEQQRVAIARALATGNPVLLADEPTGELDFQTGVQILTLLREQAERGRTVIVVTHNREIARIADRVVELSDGHIVADGPPPRRPRPGLAAALVADEHRLLAAVVVARPAKARAAGRRDRDDHRSRRGHLRRSRHDLRVAATVARHHVLTAIRARHPDLGRERPDDRACAVRRGNRRRGAARDRARRVPTHRVRSGRGDSRLDDHSCRRVRSSASISARHRASTASGSPPVATSYPMTQMSRSSTRTSHSNTNFRAQARYASVSSHYATSGSRSRPST